MQAIKLIGKSEQELSALLNEELVLSIAKNTKMEYTRAGKPVVLTMIQAQNRMREAKATANLFKETSEQYATYNTVAKEYKELLQQFRALTINNEEWREMALGEVGNKEECLKVVLNISFECDEVDTSVTPTMVN